MPSKPPGAHAAAKAAKPPQAPAAQPAQPRLRVLAGPNGSGKSTIKPDLKPQWIGVFVNADEMERDLVASVGFLSLRSLEEIRLEASRISPWFLETELWKQFS